MFDLVVNLSCRAHLSVPFAPLAQRMLATIGQGKLSPSPPITHLGCRLWPPLPLVPMLRAPSVNHDASASWIAAYGLGYDRHQSSSDGIRTRTTQGLHLVTGCKPACLPTGSDTSGIFTTEPFIIHPTILIGIALSTSLRLALVDWIVTSNRASAAVPLVTVNGTNTASPANVTLPLMV